MNIIERIRELLHRREAVSITHERITLRRAADLEDGDPPWWLRIHSRAAGTIAKRRPQPLVKCPAGHQFAIAGAHRVDRWGKVDPRIACPKCEWAALVDLEEWAPA